MSYIGSSVASAAETSWYLPKSSASPPGVHCLEIDCELCTLYSELLFEVLIFYVGSDDKQSISFHLQLLWEG